MRQLKRQQQRGFALLEVTLAMALLAGISIKAMMDEYEQLRNTQIQAQALQVKNLQNAQNEYIAKYFKNLVYNTTVSGVSNIYQPTVEELATLSVGLPTNAKSTAIIGGSYKMKLTVSPAGCTPGNCQIDGLIWIDTPYKTNSTVDGARLGAAIRTIGPDGAYSTTATPGTLSGYAGQWSQANPVGSVAGILAARTGYTSSSLSYYVRLDGTNPMTGPLNMNSNAISNVTTLTSTGNITSGGAVTAAGAVSGGSLSTTGNASVSGSLSANSVSSSTTVAAGSSISAATTITAGSNIISGGTVSGGLVQATGDAASYGQTTLNRWGLANSTGNIYIEPQSGKSLVVVPTAWDSTGSFTSYFGSNYMSGNLQVASYLYTSANNWSLIARDAGGNDYTAAQSSIGSLYVNDAYFRAAGKWASQLGGANPTYAYINASYAGNTGVLTNTYGRALYVTANGGEENDYCSWRNGHDLNGYANGNLVSWTSDSGNQGYHTSNIAFWVPAGWTYQVTSAPYQCGTGRIYLTAVMF